MSNETNIDLGNASPVSAVAYAITGGKFRVRLTEDNGPGRRWGQVLDNDNNVIGEASDYTYRGKGFAVHTKPYAGYVPENQIIFVAAEESTIDKPAEDAWLEEYYEDRNGGEG